MKTITFDTSYPSVQTLVEAKAASRVRAKDATLYGFSEEAQRCAESFMGWTDLAENPPCSLKKIGKLARRFLKDGIESAVLIGQGGSTQAAMTMTKYLKDESAPFRFFTLDSDSPVRLRGVLAQCDLAKTLVIVSSKSGGTLEMRLMLSAVRQRFLQEMDERRFRSHLVAITDPGSPLAAQATDEGWAALLYGEPAVGGRFSALSVFGLFPAVLAGAPLKKMMKRAAKMERRCAQDAPDNPAIQLAAFLYDNYAQGRAKLAYVSPKRGRALGLWVEQLLAESTGKQGKGILPYLEVNPLLLVHDQGDRMAAVYDMETGSHDVQAGFAKGASYINPAIPQVKCRIRRVQDLAEHFVLWEYATAMCGYLMKVCPFDQPDVASAKACVANILDAGLPPADFADDFVGDVPMGKVQVRLSPCCGDAKSVYEALLALFGTIEPGDFFALNAFIPFQGDDRKRALEDIRFAVAERYDVPACLEVGPRYLHSTGQLQKGGPNRGVFLVLSAEEPEDAALEGQPAESLGALASAQAAGDALTLADRGRRCLHLHLPDNYGVTLSLLAALVRQVIADSEKKAPEA